MENTTFDVYEITILEYFVCYLEYGDDSGITQEEKAAIDQFLSEFDGKDYHFSWGEYDEHGYESYFARCEITHTKGSVVDGKLLVRKEGVQWKRK